MTAKARIKELLLRNYFERVLCSQSRVATFAARRILARVLRPNSFWVEKYLAARGEELMRGVNPFIHALIWGLRRGFGDLYAETERDLANKDRRYNQELEGELGTDFFKKLNQVPRGRPLIIVVTHEMSRTGAPILALNLVAELTKEFVVISVSLGAGELEPNFEAQAEAHFSLAGRASEFPIILKRISEISSPRAVIVNSLVSSHVINDIHRQGIPSLFLIHEFLGYSHVPESVRESINKASKLVFSSEVVRRDYVRSRVLTRESVKNSSVIPQGISLVPGPADYRKSVDFEFQDKIDYLLGLSKVGDSQLVIGGGTVQYRKGVDLFIEVARQVRAKRGLEDTVFAWIGDGYDPLHDFNYSVYLRDQIARSDLTRNLRVIQASASYQYALDRCSVFCLSSRLDPLPNVALDAMKSGRPIAFFEEASGLSELVGGMEVLSKGAAPYLDTAELANRVSDLLLMSRKQSFSKISREIRQFANENLSLRVYARRLIQLI